MVFVGRNYLQICSYTKRIFSCKTDHFATWTSRAVGRHCTLDGSTYSELVMISMLGLSITDFNLIEGVFWIFCSLVSLAANHRSRLVSPPFWYVLALDFLLFGISDFVEAYYPVSFLEPGGQWLFVWKIICVGGFGGCLIWYVKDRLETK